MTKFRYDIGLSEKYPFGTELEFVGVYLSEVSKILEENNFPARFLLNHKNNGLLSFDEWYIDTDSTVTIEKNNDYFGGELSSRILTDTKVCWQELEDLCAYLKELKAYVDGTCSNHVWINLTSLENEKYFFEVFSKIIAIFETDIRLFYMGDKYLIRKTSFENARLISGHLLEYINQIDFNDPDYFYNFRFGGSVGVFSRGDGINLQEYLKRKMIEIRYANGSINPVTIQNNINFSLKLIDAIIRGLFDIERLTRIIETEKDTIYSNFLFNTPDYKKFEWLAKTIATSAYDEDAFMTQYERVLKNNKNTY